MCKDLFRHVNSVTMFRCHSGLARSSGKVEKLVSKPKVLELSTKSRSATRNGNLTGSSYCEKSEGNMEYAFELKLPPYMPAQIHDHRPASPVHFRSFPDVTIADVQSEPSREAS